MATKIVIRVRKIVTNLEYFEVTNVDRLEKPLPILFEDNKTPIQPRKSISNTKKIKHIDKAFHKAKEKSKKDIIFLQ